MDLSDQIISLAFTLLSVILVPLVTALVVKLLKRIGLAVEAEQQAKIEKFAQDAVLAAEELGRAQLKAGLAKLLPEAKFQAAVKAVLVKLPNLSQAEAEALVNSELAKVRQATGDFLGATAAAVGSK